MSPPVHVDPSRNLPKIGLNLCPDPLVLVVVRIRTIIILQFIQSGEDVIRHFIYFTGN
ncbi:hypothetical protein D3C73_1367810 [compost metagenome]